MVQLKLFPHDTETFIELMGYQKPNDKAELVKVIRTMDSEFQKEEMNQNKDDFSPNAHFEKRVVVKATPNGTYWERLARVRSFCAIENGCSNLTVSIRQQKDLRLLSLLV